MSSNEDRPSGCAPGWLGAPDVPVLGEIFLTFFATLC